MRNPGTLGLAFVALVLQGCQATMTPEVRAQVGKLRDFVDETIYGQFSALTMGYTNHPYPLRVSQFEDGDFSAIDNLIRDRNSLRLLAKTIVDAVKATERSITADPAWRESTKSGDDMEVVKIYTDAYIRKSQEYLKWAKIPLEEQILDEVFEAKYRFLDATGEDAVHELCTRQVMPSYAEISEKNRDGWVMSDPKFMYLEDLSTVLARDMEYCKGKIVWVKEQAKY